MSKVAKVGSFPPMANGPLPRPDVMSGFVIARIRRLSIPCTLACLGIFAGTFYATYWRKRQKYLDYYRNTDPFELFEQIKETGLLQGAKASWQD